MTVARRCPLAETSGRAFPSALPAARLGASTGGRRRWVNGTVPHHCVHAGTPGGPDARGGFNGSADCGVSRGSVIPVPDRNGTRRASRAASEERQDVPVRTFGDRDTVVVRIGERDGESRYLAGRDDGRPPRDATSRVPPVRGRRCFVRVRPYSAWGAGGTVVTHG